MRRFDRLLDSRLTALWASATSLILGVVFAFVWSPHPWGWHGIDQYHELASALTRGEPFSTTDVPWGYAYFVAGFYRVFGERAWIPVAAQVVANASIPLMLYHLVRPLTDQRTTALATLLVGAFSFNTVYASTQSSDSMCTLLFIGSLLCFASGHRRGSMPYFAASGLLSGLVPQFRPNMLLLPVVIAGVYSIVQRRATRRSFHMTLYVAMFAVALAPWVIRNYALTGALLPTSTHGGVQLWYGSLQVGPYLESRAHNPRSLFEPASFDYTSLEDESIVITGTRQRCDNTDDAVVELVYWTDRDPQRHRLMSRVQEGARLRFDVPGQAAPTAVYYYFESIWTDASTGHRRSQATPLTAPARPPVYFIAHDHLGDLDRHHDLLDIFDVMRLVRHLAWAEPISPELAALDVDGTAEDDLKVAIVRLLGDGATMEVVSSSPVLSVTADAATLRLSDGSSLTVPRQSTGLVTDLDVRGSLAGSLIPARRPWRVPATDAQRAIDSCRVDDVRVNDVFYRKEPHLMRRYIALAMDNISRDPWAFIAASVYRMGRLFIVRGTNDVNTTQQFGGSRYVYVAGQALSVLWLISFTAGMVIARRSHPRLLVFLIPIVYVPLTICFVLTNMRYSVTVQPLMFVFVAVTMSAVMPIGGRAGRLATARPPRSRRATEPGPGERS